MKVISRIFLGFFLVLMILPVWMLVTGTFMDGSEIASHIGGVLTGEATYATWPVLPVYPTLRAYIKLLLDSPEFFHMFWNSIRQTGLILIGYLFVALPAGWAFARYEFPLKRQLFFLYIVLMILPFQVTMVSNYLVILNLGLMDKELAIILPAIFSTFPVFILAKFYGNIPKALFEAAQVDGANELQIYMKIGLPLGFPGIVSALVLTFIDNWNAIEQPLIFLQTKSKWPLSLYIPNIGSENVGIAFTASAITMMPALLIFLFGQGYLEEGFAAAGIKE